MLNATFLLFSNTVEVVEKAALEVTEVKFTHLSFNFIGQMLWICIGQIYKKENCDFFY